MQTLVPWLVAAGPLALAAAGLAPRRWADRRPAAMARLAAAAAALALAAALGAAALSAVHGRVDHVFAGPVGIYLDALSATMLVLVAFVGAIVVRYAARYLDGDPGQGRFLRWLCLTLAAVLTLTVSGNLVLLAAAWIATSLALHRLLVFYPERRAAQLAARKKFIASRIGDACVIGATVLVYQAFGTVSFGTLFAADGPLSAGSQDIAWIAALLVLAAVLKSAQFPFHGWLPEVMETPTPVSALLHAGIVNAGGFLIVRMSPLMTEAPGALDALVLVGGFTALFGAAVMLTQTSIKGSLAWSTVAQMGFMLLQCGLGAFAAAVLHIVAHSLYKAYAFLSSGSVVDIARAAWTPSATDAPRPAAAALALGIALAAALGAGALLGVTPMAQPGVVALAAILAMGIAHLMVQALAPRPVAGVVLRATGLATAVSIAYFVLQSLAESLLRGAVAPTVAAHGPAGVVLPALVVAAFAAAFLAQSLLGTHAQRPRWRAAYVHLANGLYVNTCANRLVERLWPVRPARGSTLARSAT